MNIAIVTGASSGMGREFVRQLSHRVKVDEIWAIVRRQEALKDLYSSKKDYSVHGLPIRNQVRPVKIMPHRIVMTVWQSQQKKAKNNKGLMSK